MDPANLDSSKIHIKQLLCIDSDLLVDSWEQHYVENKNTGEYEMVERYAGEEPVGKTSEYKYLGFIISSKGDNMANINAIKKKSVGIIRTLLHKLDDMNLKKYNFEFAIFHCVS